MEASAVRAPAGIGVRRSSGVLLRLRTDEQLVALFRQGHEDAFRVIHDRYRQRLSAYARQMLGGSATDADDAMQDVFLRAYGALRADDRPITLRAWLYRVAHNRCIDHIRRPASQPTVELSEDARPLPATTGDPILAAERRDDLRRLVLDLRALPEQQRSALLMREMEGLTYQELAGALEVTVPAVKSLLVRARIGLVESQRARDTPCQEIREDITAAHDRGVRMSGRARRHAKECDSCAGYRATLKVLSDDISALNPASGPWAGLLKLVGLGAGGSSAAGGAAAAGGAGAGAAGGVGTVAAGAAATKFAAVVCCAVVVGGGAAEVRHQTSHTPAPAVREAKGGASATATSTRSAPASAVATPGGATLAAARARAAEAGRAREVRAAAAARRREGTPIAALVAGGSTVTGSDLAGGDPAAVDPDGGATAPAEEPTPAAEEQSQEMTLGQLLGAAVSGGQSSSSPSTSGSSSQPSGGTATTNSAPPANAPAPTPSQPKEAVTGPEPTTTTAGAADGGQSAPAP